MSKNYLDNIPKPFVVLAPMDDVTDTVFRRHIARTAPADLYMTEFVSVDGLQSPGRTSSLKRLKFTQSEQPLIAQIWGKDLDNYEKTAREIADGSLAAEANEVMRDLDVETSQGADEKRTEPYMRYGEGVSESVTQLSATSSGRVLGSAQKRDRTIPNFAGVDINMGCPDKAVLKNGCGGALSQDPDKAVAIIKAVQAGVNGKIPVSVKTRVGFREFDRNWINTLLEQKLNMLSIHLRTVREMSKVPAHYELLTEIKQMRDAIAPDTALVANGDIMNRDHGEELAEKYGVDGVMIGRGVFHDPFACVSDSPWQNLTPTEKINLYLKHVELFEQTWQEGERPIVTLNKFCKIYVNGFAGAKDCREQLMQCRTIAELKACIQQIRASLQEVILV